MSAQRSRQALEETLKDLEYLQEHIQELQDAFQKTLKLIHRIYQREKHRQMEELQHLTRGGGSNVHFQSPDAGLVELIPTGNVVRVFLEERRPLLRTRKREARRRRVALLMEASPLQEESLQYGAHFVIVRYDLPAHFPRLHRVISQFYEPSHLPWVRDPGVEVYTHPHQPVHHYFEILAQTLHDQGYEVYVTIQEEEGEEERGDEE